MNKDSEKKFDQTQTCSCQGLNQNCFKRYGSGMYLPKQGPAPEFDEAAYRTRIKKGG